MRIESAYVQKRGGEYLNETSYSFANGCRLLGVHVETFEEEALKHVSLPREAVVHGTVRVVKNALRALGVEEPVPRVDGMPPAELLPFYGRRVWTSTLGEIRRRWPEGAPLFIKPLKEHKAFTGFVMTGEFRDLIPTASFPDEMEVLCSEVVDFVSEYRLFVHNGLIVDCRRYNGDFTRLVDFDVAQDCIRWYKDAPVSWSLDLGVTRKGATSIVEINDAFALGSYGMASRPYAMMVIDRWCQMVGV